MNSMLRTIVFVSFCHVFVMGCSSISSQLVEPTKGPDGAKVTSTKGMPITIEVPTHIKVIIQETRYYYKSGTDWKPLMGVQNCPVTARSILHEKITSKKIFTVDFKRPAAGQLKYTAKFDAATQYLSSIDSDVNDVTISEASKAFERILLALPKLPTVAPGASRKAAVVPPGASDLKEVTSIAAMRIFSLEDPMLEANIATFVESELYQSSCGVPGMSMGQQGTPPKSAIEPIAVRFTANGTPREEFQQPR